MRSFLRKRSWSSTCITVSSKPVSAQDCGVYLLWCVLFVSACRSEEEKLEQYIKAIADSGAKVSS
jgi:hypothetical protein